MSQNKIDTSIWDAEARQHEKRVYFNKPQLMAQYIGAKTTVIVAGRRTGKTDSIASPFVLRNMQRMPGSTGGIVVPTFKHGLTNTIPGLLAAWKRWGYLNGIHYVVGRKPPKSFAKPITEPADYEHVITFYNGSMAVIISQDRPGSSNSLTLSWLLIDEAKFIDYNKLKDETLPANGGIRSYFGHHSFNHAMMVLSDMPQTQKGSWFLHYREKMDPQLIETIQGTIYKIWETKERIARLKEQHQPIPQYLKGYLKWLDQSLNKMRSVAVYYKEYSTIENLQLLGEEYLRQMKRDLTPKTFQTSILCQRIGITHDGFYSSMQEHHKYDASNFAYLDELGYDKILKETSQQNYDIKAASQFSTLGSSIDSRADEDVNPLAPICIGMDYNANINWIVAGQPSQAAPAPRNARGGGGGVKRGLQELGYPRGSPLNGTRARSTLAVHEFAETAWGGQVQDERHPSLPAPKKKATRAPRREVIPLYHSFFEKKALLVLFFPPQKK